MTEEVLINKAPTAGLKRNPQGINNPAAAGIASRL